MAGRRHRAKPQLERARALLREQPIDPVPLAREIKRTAKALGISMATLARARREERILTIGGRGPGSQPRWLRQTTPHRPRMPTLPADRFGIDCAAYASAPDSAGTLWHPTRTYEILTRALAGQFNFRLDKNQAPEPTLSERRFRYFYRYTLSCILPDADQDVASLRIQYGPADRDAAAFRVSVHSDMEHLLDLDWVDAVLLRLREGLSSKLPSRRVNAFWQLVYLETTYDIPITDGCFQDLLPLVQADGITDAGTDIWPWQDYVQYGSPRSNRFAAMYEKTEQALAALRTECRFRRAYLEDGCGIVDNSDLRRVGFSQLFHLRLPEPFEARRRACTEAYETVIRGAAGAGTRTRAPLVPCGALMRSAPRAPMHPVRLRLIETQARRMINGRLERGVARPVLDQQERITYLQEPSPALAATLTDIDVHRVDAVTVSAFRRQLTHHIRRLCQVEHATQGTAEYPGIVSMLDASVQARHALKRWRRSLSLAAAEGIRDHVQAYLDLVLLAQR